jgi:phenylalanyl-tRNA synthetase alpha chain
MKKIMNKLQQLIKETSSALKESLKKVTSIDELEAVRIDFLGRNGKIAALMPELKKLDGEGKRIIGPLMNTLKQESQELYFQKKHALETAQLNELLADDKYFDVTLSKPATQTGSIHPITQTYLKVQEIFLSMGYEIHEGTEVESPKYNFESLNIPEDHPARDMWDTFWLELPNLLMRTHTSTVQIHAMEEQELPLALIAPGRVYRHEATDATHDFQFNQVEGLVIDKGINLSHLLGTIELFLRKFFEDETLIIKVRPSYFPFVEPGIEIDMQSKHFNNKWIEIAGAGLVHPHVLKACDIDHEKFSGFAFGFGLDRLTMLKHRIPDIRLFRTNKLEFLKQF